MAAPELIEPEGFRKWRAVIVHCPSPDDNRLDNASFVRRLHGLPPATAWLPRAVAPWPHPDGWPGRQRCWQHVYGDGAGALSSACLAVPPTSAPPNAVLWLRQPAMPHRLACRCRGIHRKPRQKAERSSHDRVRGVRAGQAIVTGIGEDGRRKASCHRHRARPPVEGGGPVKTSRTIDADEIARRLWNPYRRLIGSRGRKGSNAAHNGPHASNQEYQPIRG